MTLAVSAPTRVSITVRTRAGARRRQSAFLCVPTSPCPQCPIQVPPCSCLVRACRASCADPEPRAGPTNAHGHACGRHVHVHGQQAPLRGMAWPGPPREPPPHPRVLPDSMPPAWESWASASPGTPVPLGERPGPKWAPLTPSSSGWGPRVGKAARTHRPFQQVKPRPGRKPALDLEASKQDVVTGM